MDVVPPEEIDPTWWAEKIKNLAIEYCPQCRPEIDPRDSAFVPQPCDVHARDQGSADARAHEKRPVVTVYIPDYEFL